MNKWIIACLLLVTSVAFSGCIFFKKTTRSTAPGRTDTTVSATHTADTTHIAHADTSKATLHTDTVANAVRPDTAHITTTNTQLIANATNLWHQPFTYTTFDGKAKMHYEGNGSSHDFTANFRIKKDSVVWVLVTALGGMLPVARAYITPDSIKVVNYLNREVLLMPISQATRLLPAPVDFSILQNLIVGQPLLNNGTITNAKDSLTAWIIAITDNNYAQQFTYAKEDSTLRAQIMTTGAANGPKVSIQLTSHVRDGNRQFSRSRTVHIDNNGNLYELNMDFTSQSFDKPLDFPFSYSSKYAINPSK